MKLDHIDRQILKDLQTDGRMTNVELAKRAGISAPPCLRRMRALEEAGYILGYHANIAPHKLGYSITVFANVGLHKQNDYDLKEFEARVAAWPNVRECHMLAGATDFLLKVVAESWDEYQHFLTTMLTTADNVASVKSSLAVKNSKYEPGVPINTPAHLEIA